MKVKQSLLKYISPAVSMDERLKAARLELEDGTAPEDEVTVLFALSHDRDAIVATAAKKTFEAYPLERMLKALERRLDPLVIRGILGLHKDTEPVVIMAALNEGADDGTLKAIAESGPEEIVSIFMSDSGLLERRPCIAEGLRKNPLTPKSALDRLASTPERGERVDAEAEAIPAALTGADDAAQDEHNIYQAVKSMSMGQKVKLALTGSKAAREFLIKDTNKIIAISVLKNPRITEDEVSRVISSKSTPEDLLREVARNKDWLKNYGIKYTLATNPKTPFTISLKLLDHIYEKDLEKIAKSKNVPSVVASSARRKLDARKR